MSYITASSSISVSIPCIRLGCLANRVGSSLTCMEHRPAPSGRQRKQSRIKQHAALASTSTPQGDNGNTRPRTLRFINADDIAVSRDVHQRRLSEDETSALGRFLKDQHGNPSESGTPTNSGRSMAGKKLSSDKQQALEKLLSPRPSPDQLRSRNIMKDNAAPTSSFHERIRSLEMQLGTRSPREELVDQRIIVDTTNDVQARGDVLLRLLGQRSSPDALAKKNILKANGDLSRFDPDAAGDASAAIIVESAKERLERMLRSRPTAKTLVAKNILKQTSPAIADRQRRLDLHQRRHSLTDKLRHRPTSQQLVDLGIIEEEDEAKTAQNPDQEAIKNDDDGDYDAGMTTFNPALPILTPDLKSAARVGDSTQFQHVLFVWGQGHHGQLGLDNTRSQPFPTLCRALGHLQIRVVMLGAQHTLALSGDGELFGWGSCARGQLGLGDGAPETIRSPTSLHVSHSPLCNQRAALIAAGAFHSAFTVAGTGGVFVMGAGMGAGGDIRVPVMATGLEGVAVEHLACGRQHCAAVASSGDLWTWGRGSEGQLGRGPRADGDVVVPGRIDTHAEFWAGVVCGGDHTVAVGYDQCVYAWGDNSLGQLGLPGVSIPGHFFEPQQVKALARKGIVQIACSQNHTAALSDNGTIYSTTIVSRSDSGSNFIRLPPTHCFTSVAAGINLTTATTAGGIIYQWQMDQGLLQSQRITTVEGIDLTSMSGGYRHFAALGRVPAGALDTTQMKERSLDGINEDETAEEPGLDSNADMRQKRRRRPDKHKRHETLVHIEPEMRSVQQD